MEEVVPQAGAQQRPRGEAHTEEGVPLRATAEVRRSRAREAWRTVTGHRTERGLVGKGNCSGQRDSRFAMFCPVSLGKAWKSHC